MRSRPSEHQVFTGTKWLAQDRFSNFTSDYKSDILIYIAFSLDRGNTRNTGMDILLPNSHVSNNIYNPTGMIATFPGTLADVMKDDDFHLEYLWGSERLILTTTQKCASQTGRPFCNTRRRQGNTKLAGPGKQQHLSLRDPAEVRRWGLWRLGINRR